MVVRQSLSIDYVWFVGHTDSHVDEAPLCLTSHEMLVAGKVKQIL